MVINFLLNFDKNFDSCIALDQQFLFWYVKGL